MTVYIVCPMSKSSELFSYTATYSSFKQTEPLFSELSFTCTQTERRKDRKTERHADGDEYSIVTVDKPQL